MFLSAKPLAEQGHAPSWLVRSNESAHLNYPVNMVLCAHTSRLLSDPNSLPWSGRVSIRSRLHLFRHVVYRQRFPPLECHFRSLADQMRAV